VRPLTVTALLLLAASAARLDAQALRVRAASEQDGLPVAGAIADVLDPQGRVVTQALLNDVGVRLMPLDGPGTYVVRVRRIGFEPFLSAPVAVAATDTVDLPLRVSMRRVLLGALHVTDERRCARDIDAGSAIALLLEEARKALTSTALGRADSGTVVEARRFERELDVAGESQLVRVTLPRRVVDARPFTASSASGLSDSGYVRLDGSGIVIFGPDEQVLASDAFVRDHCFEMAPGRHDDRRLLGVRFIPGPKRRTADIGGTLWVDSASAELRYLDFWYQGGNAGVQSIGKWSGGQVVFERLANGRWIVSAWRLRMPHFESRSTPIERRVTRSRDPVGYEESGGVITPAGGRREVPTALVPYLDLLRPARIAGTVYDSLAGRPLAGAQVWLEPDDRGSAWSGAALAVGRRTATADAEGRYRLDSIPAGAYRIGVDAPALDSAGVPLPRFVIQLQPGMTVDGPLATPSRATVARGCQAAVGEPFDGIVFGTVRATAQELQVRRAAVRLSWTSPGALGTVVPRDVVAWADSTGTYRVCGVPADRPVTVQAFANDVASGWIDVRLGDERVLQRDVFVPLTLAGAAMQRGATLRGLVRDAGGRPAAGVRVAVDGWPSANPAVSSDGASAVTDRNGHFELARLTSGSQSGVVTGAGYLPLRFATELRNGDTTVVDLTLAPATPTTGPASASVAVAIARHPEGWGTLVTGEALTRAPHMRAVAATLPNVRLYHAPPLPFTPKGLEPNAWVALSRLDEATCALRVLIDRVESDANAFMALDPSTLRAIEVYPRNADAPPFARLDGAARCGIIMAWTAAAP